MRLSCGCSSALPMNELGWREARGIRSGRLVSGVMSLPWLDDGSLRRRGEVGAGASIRVWISRRRACRALGCSWRIEHRRFRYLVDIVRLQSIGPVCGRCFTREAVEVALQELTAETGVDGPTQWSNEAW